MELERSRPAPQCHYIGSLGFTAYHSPSLSCIIDQLPVQAHHVSMQPEAGDSCDLHLCELIGFPLAPSYLSTAGSNTLPTFASKLTLSDLSLFLKRGIVLLLSHQTRVGRCTNRSTNAFDIPHMTYKLSTP